MTMQFSTRNRSRRLLFVICAVPLGLIAAPVLAAETLGALTFEFAGETTEWQTISREARGKIRHSASLSRGDLIDQFELTAYPVQSGLKERFNIALTFGHPLGAMSEANYDRPTDVSIIRLLGGITGPRWEARDVTIDYSLEQATEETGEARGTFSATFCYHESVYADADESSCESGEGRFETGFRIEKEE